LAWRWWCWTARSPATSRPSPETFAETLLFWATLMRNQAVLPVDLAFADVPVLYLPGPPVRTRRRPRSWKR